MPEPAFPDLSVIVPSVNGWADLQECLAALGAQTGGAWIETIVVDRVGDPVREPLRRLFPAVRLVEAPANTTIPHLRALGFRTAVAGIVGVLEDHVIVPPDWAAKMLSAHEEGAEVVGGAVENTADESLVDWAAFLCEYSHCLAPPVGPSSWVTGNNVTYRRALLERFDAAVREGLWEDHLHETMRRAGITLWSRPEIRVGHKKHYTVGEYVEQRYLYARAFAAMRVRTRGRLRRLGYGVAAVALPPLLFSRIVSRVAAARVHRRQLVRSLPLLALFVTAWATGEVAGYWWGDGNSLAKVC